MNAPLFTVTGWDHPGFPPEEVVPVFGVYPDAFWESSLKPLPASPAYLFDFTHDLDIPPATPATSKTETPRDAAAGDEISFAAGGGGRRNAGGVSPAAGNFRRRCRGDCDNACGGGREFVRLLHVPGRSESSGEENDIAGVRGSGWSLRSAGDSYDFQAPLGEYGQVRPSFRALKLIHYFLGDFGELLAPMSVYAPAVLPKGPEDTETVRAALRSDGRQGFLFVNNYLRDYPMAEKKGVQFELKLAGGTVMVPHKPMDVPSGAYFIWPVGVKLQGVGLRYATAQMICAVKEKMRTTYFFFAPRGMAAEFAFDGKSVKSLQAPGAQVRQEEGSVYVEKLRAGTDVAIRAVGGGRRRSEHCGADGGAGEGFVEGCGGREGVVISAADVTFDAGEVQLRSTRVENFAVGVFPKREMRLARGAASLEKGVSLGVFEKFPAKVDGRTVPVRWEVLREAEASQAVRQGKYNAVAPTNADFARAGEWQVALPGDAMRGLSNLFLKIDYIGDVGRLYWGGTLLDDNFYFGGSWEIGMKRFLSSGRVQAFDLKIMPLRKDAPIFLAAGAWPEFGARAEIAEIRSITTIPEYEVVVH